MLKFLHTTLFLFTGFVALSQTDHSYVVIDLDQLDTEVVPFCILGKNHVIFRSGAPIDSIYTSYSGGSWNVKKTDENYYWFEPRFHPMSQKLIYDSTLRIHVVRNGGELLEFDLPVIAYPPIGFYVLNYSGTKVDLNQDTIEGLDRFACKVKWIYPFYVKSYQRYRGVFRVQLIHNKEVLRTIDGWYDTGDQTKGIAVSDYIQNGVLEVRIMDSFLRTTLNQYIRFPGKRPAIRLSEESKSVYYLRKP